MKLRTESIAFNELDKNKVQRLVDGHLDLLYINQVVSSSVVSNVPMIENESVFAGKKIQISDGYFYPLPYAAVHADTEGQEEQWVENYFSTAKHFIAHFQDILGRQLAENIFNIMNRAGILKENILINANGQTFAPFNIRNLKAGGNGILIHCENSFLNELDSDFRSTLYDSVDIENALSFLFILQAPEQGGELILFESNWKEAPIKLNECSMLDRHVDSVQLFSKNGHETPSYIRFPAKSGDLIVFRAAQIWHTVNTISGNTNRISIGTFVAPDKQGVLRYWA